MQWLIILPIEIVAASITINFWNKTLHRSIFVTIFLVLIIAINLFGVKGYGEAEFVFSLVKVIAVIGFIILGIIINCAGNPNGGYIGGKFWVEPGPFNNGFKGLCSVFVTAAFAFSGTELIGLAAAETANPRKSLPTAIKQVFWRITLFYIVSLTLVGLLVAHDDKRLLNEGTANTNATASPFVIAIEDTVLPSVMNVKPVESSGQNATSTCSFQYVLRSSCRTSSCNSRNNIAAVAALAVVLLGCKDRKSVV